MDFVKRYPILTAILAFCLAAFAAESYFLWSFNRSVSLADKDRGSTRTKAENAEKLSPAPSADNRDAAQANAADLKTVLDTVKSTFQDTPIKITDVPGSGPELLVQIQAYASDLQAKAKDRDIILPNPDFTFGMAMYVGRGVSAPPADKIPDVYTQMKALQYILNHLMDDAKQPNQEMKIISVMREDITAVKAAPGIFVPGANDNTDDEKNEVFTVDPAVTARVPGFVNTLAFQIKFVTYSESLRLLLQDLKQFEMPLVVRSIQVEPAAVEHAAPGSDAAAAKKSTVSDTAKPVVAENLSQFTLVIEYIQLPTPPAPAGDAGTAPAPAAATGTSH